MTIDRSFNAAGVHPPMGVGLKAQHYQEALSGQHPLAFFEVHAENYMMQGGNHLRFLEAIGEKFPLSIHGVGMSLGSEEGLNAEHLSKFKKIVDRFHPTLVSEHLAWSVQGGNYLNDLLPLPLNKTTLDVVADNIKLMQDTIGRRILVENPSTYVSFNATDIPEPEYLNMLAEATGCGILLDVNNVYVSGRNHGFSVTEYVDAIDGDQVGEIHLAGHTVKEIEGVELRLDDHGSPVIDDVWNLYGYTVGKIGARPTLIEWDTDIPEFSVLIGQVEKAIAVAQAALPNEEAYDGAA